MFLKRPDVPVGRRLTITLPESVWKQLDAMTQETGAQGVLEHTLAGFLQEALRKEERRAKRGSREAAAARE